MVNGRPSRRKKADDLFPTVVRYAGVVIILVLAINAIFTNNGVEYPGLIVAASGMILYKTVRGENGNSNGK